MRMRAAWRISTSSVAALDLAMFWGDHCRDFVLIYC